MARSYRIAVEGKVATPDLCSEHAAPLDAFFTDPLPEAKPAKAIGRPRKSTTPTMTLEEIEARKQAKSQRDQ